uniref:Uncharacterized protein n=1 Tax=Aromatoleum toluolicum TaxID=90060 RepID=A0ABX1NHS8_9RHOO|nr:hypothetical protein [Aromatoleum toluolicum]
MASFHPPSCRALRGGRFIAQPGAVERFISIGQRLVVDLLQAPVPVVGVLTGSALAGGFELLLHCHAIQAHAESAMGLVEAQVGIVPGWGGCREMLARSAAKVGVGQAIAHCFDLLRTCKVSASAQEARELGFLCDRDDITIKQLANCSIQSGCRTIYKSGPANERARLFINGSALDSSICNHHRGRRRPSHGKSPQDASRFNQARSSAKGFSVPMSQLRVAWDVRLLCAGSTQVGSRLGNVPACVANRGN